MPWPYNMDLEGHVTHLYEVGQGAWLAAMDYGRSLEGIALIGPTSLNQNPLTTTARPTLIEPKSYKRGKTIYDIGGSFQLVLFSSLFSSFYFFSPLKIDFSNGGILPYIYSTL